MWGSWIAYVSYTPTLLQGVWQKAMPQYRLVNLVAELSLFSNGLSRFEFNERIFN